MVLVVFRDRERAEFTHAASGEAPKLLARVKSPAPVNDEIWRLWHRAVMAG